MAHAPAAHSRSRSLIVCPCPQDARRRARHLDFGRAARRGGGGPEAAAQNATPEAAAHGRLRALGDGLRDRALAGGHILVGFFCGNRDAAVEEVIDADPIAAAVPALMARCTEWTGTASDLVGVLAEAAGERVARSKTWPDNPRALAGRLRRAATFLRKIGIEVMFGREGRARTRTIRITAAPESGGRDRPHSPHRPRLCQRSTAATTSRLIPRGRSLTPRTVRRTITGPVPRDSPPQPVEIQQRTVADVADANIRRHFGVGEGTATRRQRPLSGALGCRDPVERIDAVKSDDPHRRRIVEFVRSFGRKRRRSPHESHRSGRGTARLGRSTRTGPSTYRGAASAVRGHACRWLRSDPTESLPENGARRRTPWSARARHRGHKRLITMPILFVKDSLTPNRCHCSFCKRASIAELRERGTKQFISMGKDFNSRPVMSRIVARKR
jgi:hypothetical protein